MNFSQLNFVNQIKKSKNEKRARWLTLAILVLTVGLSLGFGFLSYLRENSLNLPSFSLPLLNRPRKISTKLDPWGKDKISELSGQWAIQVRLLAVDQTWSYQTDHQMPAPGFFSLPAAVIFYQQVEAGVYNLEETYTLTSEDKDLGGALAVEPVGREISWQRIIDLAVFDSDRAALEILNKELGQGLIDQKIREWGMERTDIKNNLTTAGDVGLFYQKLYQGMLVDETHQQIIIDNLINAVSNGQIPDGVPEGIQVAGQAGGEAETIYEGGIIFVPDNPMVLVIISRGGNRQESLNVLPELVRDIYWRVIEN